MTTVGAFAAGLVVAAVLWPLLRTTLAAPVFEQENFRGRRIPGAAGIAVVLAALVVVGGWTTLDVLVGDVAGAGLGRSVRAAAVLAGGFGVIGLLDDLAGSGDRRGFRGHLGALVQGQLTTGMIKLGGGAVVAIVVVAPWASDHLGDLCAAALVVALAANLGNLLDRAPGRVGKVTLLVVVVLAAVSRLDGELCGPAVIAGAGAAMLWPDLRERCMLGDTGANVIGAGAGLALVATTGPGAWWVAAAVLAVLNLLSERVSFSRVIDRTPPLRWFDRLGAPPR